MIQTELISGRKSHSGLDVTSASAVDKKETLRTVSNSGIYCWNDTFGTGCSSVYFRKFRRQHQCSCQDMACGLSVEWNSSISENIRNRTHVRLYFDSSICHNVVTIVWHLFDAYDALETGFVSISYVGSVVVEALCLKPEGRGFETVWGVNAFFNLPNPSGRTRPWGLLSL
jgi:hypothetical protein